ncbi:hypothetical protein [Pseudanabaena sp. PCC 6802]|uniref:hypothetical protein n=1 Tax=Pseudanabaena sp. PCC 6802 TaxID=118173 RepID=UPI000349B314|nr:hypothetical protein [Pseudanabaena sp. PCC 6802]
MPNQNMLDNLCLKAFVTILFTVPFILKGASEGCEISKRNQEVPASQKSFVELQKEKLKDYLPSAEKKLEIWSFVFSNRERFKICNYTGSFFDREFKKNKDRQLNIFRVGENKFFVEVLCFWASYQGNFEFFIYEKSNQKVSLRPLPLKEVIIEDGGLLKEVSKKSVAGLPTFNPKNRTFRMFSRAGGSDCGSHLAEYKYEDNKLNLLVFKVNLPCARRNPEEYPIIYPRKSS